MSFFICTRENKTSSSFCFGYQLITHFSQETGLLKDDQFCLVELWLLYLDHVINKRYTLNIFSLRVPNLAFLSNVKSASRRTADDFSQR